MALRYSHALVSVLLYRCVCKLEKPLLPCMYEAMTCIFTLRYCSKEYIQKPKKLRAYSYSHV